MNAFASRPTSHQPFVASASCRVALLIGVFLPGGLSPALSAPSPASSAEMAPKPTELSAAGFEEAVKPLIKESCVNCHNAKRLKGDLDLERFLTTAAPEALQHRELWELVISRVRAGEMPPEDEERPPATLVSGATKWIEEHFAWADRNAPLNPGRVTVRRLNRIEYNNTIRDLLGVNLRFGDDFPPDPESHGFDNNGEVLSLSPVLTEGYLNAAELVAQAAIPAGPPPPALASRYNSEAIGQQFRLHVQTTHNFPVDGRYNLRLGWEQGNPSGSRYVGRIFIDGEEVLKESVIFKTYQDRSIYANNVPVRQGSRKIEVRMEVAPAAEQPKKGSVRPPFPTVIEVFGPLETVSKEQTESYRRIFFQGPPTTDTAPGYAREIFAKLLPRAFRRAVTASELDRVVKLTERVQSRGGSFEAGIRVGLMSVLMSPNFLFRIERERPGDLVQRISDPELASRLSYFLWRSMPDDTLLSLAEEGRLHEPDILRAQVKRMLADPKAYSLASDFVGQWLQTRNLDTNLPDRATFPDYDFELRDAMRKETELFFEAIVAENRNIVEFLDGKFTFLNQRLAQHYGIAGVEGREFRRVELDGNERSGVLTHASVLTATSYPTRTSPVIRGKWVLENILSSPPPPPPPDVPALDDQAVGKTVSLREQLEKHRANAECASCHARMDPLGFGLDNYDAVGRWRTRDGEFAVDPSGRLPNGTTFSGSKELKAVLRADAPRFVRSISEKLLTYALGRGLGTHDRPAVEKIAQRVEQNEGRFSELVAAIVESAPFQMRTRDPSETPAVPDRQASASPRR